MPRGLLPKPYFALNTISHSSPAFTPSSPFLRPGMSSASLRLISYSVYSDSSAFQPTSTADSNLLVENRLDRYNILFALVFYAVAVGLSSWFGAPYIGFHYNNVHGNVVVIYLLGICGVMAVLYLCKVVKRLPIVSYCGRYSIILLCTHHLFYRPIKLVLMKLSFVPTEYVVWITAVLTLLCCYISIPLCIKYIPYFTAQKDLIKTK